MMSIVLAAAVLAVAASKSSANRPYVQSGPDGVFYARCVPDADTGPAGTTRVYHVGRDKDDLVDAYDWYAQEGATLGWSPIAGKVAVMARRSRAGAELTFHLGGKTLASYTAADRGHDGAIQGQFVILELGDTVHAAALSPLRDRLTDAGEVIRLIRQQSPGCVNIANANILFLVPEGL